MYRLTFDEIETKRKVQFETTRSKLEIANDEQLNNIGDIREQCISSKVCKQLGEKLDSKDETILSFGLGFYQNIDDEPTRFVIFENEYWAKVSDSEESVSQLANFLYLFPEVNFDE